MAASDEHLAETYMAPQIGIGVAVGIGDQDRDQDGCGRVAGQRDDRRRIRDTYRRAPLNPCLRYCHALASRSLLRYSPRGVPQSQLYGNPPADAAPATGRPGRLAAGALARA